MTAEHARLTWDEVPPRTEPAVRQALQHHRPHLVQEFEAELERATTSQEHQHAVFHWWALIVGVMHPDPDADEAHTRLLAGDESHLVSSPF